MRRHRCTDCSSNTPVKACKAEALGAHLAIQLPVRRIQENSATHWLMQRYKSSHLNRVWLHLQAKASWTEQLTLANPV